jgi:hypothetical protein
MQSAQTDRMHHEKSELTLFDFLCQVIRGVAVSLGLILLWSMEAVRDRFFRVLDRFHVPERRRSKASPFPPGPTRVHKT